MSWRGHGGEELGEGCTYIGELEERVLVNIRRPKKINLTRRNSLV
jgi:hypothetical protein